MHYAGTKRKHVNRALTWLLVMVLSWIAVDVYTALLAIDRSFFRWAYKNPLLVGMPLSFLSIVPHIATIFAASHVIRSNVCVATYQRIAAWSISVYALILAIYALLMIIAFVQLYQQFHAPVSGGVGPAPFPLSMVLRSTHWETWLSTLPMILTGLAWLTLLLPPALKLSNWAPIRIHIARIFAVLFLCTTLLPEAIPFLVDRDFFWFADRYMRDEYALFGWRNIIIASEFVVFIALAIFLFQLRKHASSLTFDPNHCATCDYPLEPSFTTCPECGTKRDALNPE